MARVLLVEDDRATRRFLQVHLEEWGHEVVVAKDGVEGWQWFKDEPEVRIAVIDWLMPRMDGVELIGKIREYEDREGRNRCYIVLLTGRVGREEVMTGLGAGADDYVVKDDTCDELRARVEMAERQLEYEAELGDGET